jgi:hypothetical protein
MREQVNALIREHKGVLKRNKKHEVWKFPGGQTFVRAKTPSDNRADANNLADLRKILGLEREVKPVRERPVHPAPKAKRPAPVATITEPYQPPVKKRPTVPLGTFAASFARRAETTNDPTEREALQSDLDRLLWEAATGGIRRME